jgi:hypothetical protein
VLTRFLDEHGNVDFTRDISTNEPRLISQRARELFAGRCRATTKNNPRTFSDELPRHINAHSASGASEQRRLADKPFSHDRIS